MIGAADTSCPTYISPIRFRSWMPHDAETVGDDQIPVLKAAQLQGPPQSLCAVDKTRSARQPQNALVHGFRADRILEPLARNPRPYVARFGHFAGVITPDFSLYRSMPRCERVYHTRVARGLGAYFQSRGLVVVANVRWAGESDFDFCFLGVPHRSVVAVSAHGCLRSREDRHHFGVGLEAMVAVLQPSSVIVHGPMPDRIFGALTSQVQFVRFPSDIETAHRKAA